VAWGFPVPVRDGRGQGQRSAAGADFSVSFSEQRPWAGAAIRARSPARIAYASAKEVDSHLRLLAAAGAVHDIGAEQALGTFDEVRAMTWRLINPL
jgi:hypothetical protein